MRFGARQARGGGRAIAHGLGAGALRAVMATLVIAAAAAALVVYQLGRAPIPLPGLSDALEASVNANSPQIRLDIGTASLALSRRSGRPTLRFDDVRVRSVADGALLLSVPALTARFSAPDLLAGRVRLSGVTIVGPSARLVRTADGRLRFDLVDGLPPPAGPAPPGAGPEPSAPVARGRGFEAVRRVLDSLAGTGETVDEVALLRRLRIADATLLYENEATGTRWRTESAQLVLRRGEAGLSGTLELPVTTGQGETASVTVTAERAFGSEDTTVEALLRGLSPGAIAREVAELSWLGLVDAPLSGRLATVVRPDGALGPVEGELWADGGAFFAETGPVVFDGAAIGFAYDEAADRLELRHLVVDSDAAEVRLGGVLALRRAPGGGLAGLAAQLDVEALELDLPELFAEPVAFDGGQVVARVGFDPMTVDVASARLSQGALELDLSGRALGGPEGWVSDFRATGSGLSVEALKVNWPLTAAANARSWVDRHLVSGQVDDLVAQIRLDRRTGAPPQISLDFRFSDLVSRYLHDMPAIGGARGRGHLDLDRFHLALDAGHVEPVEGARIALGGSEIEIALDTDPPTADIALRARGPLAAALDLIDREPLSLVGRLGLPAGEIAGEAGVSVAIALPLLADLRLEQVEVAADAVLTGVRMTAAPPDRPALALASERLELTADTRAMRLSGPVVAAGTTVRVDWREVYGGGPGRREVALSGAATPGLLGALGAGVPGFEAGRAPLDARLTQASGGPPGFTLEVDLGPAALAVPEIGWRKAEGEPGTLSVAGRLGDAPVIERFSLDAAGLVAAGSAELDGDGALRAATLDTLRAGDWADLGVVVSAVTGRGLSATLTGRFLDLGRAGEVLAGGGGGGGGADRPRVAIDFDIDRVNLTADLPLLPARGRLVREADGSVRAEFSGRVQGFAAVDGAIAMPAEGDGSLDLGAPDAGAFLRALGVAKGASGGTLTLDATLGDGGGRAEGMVRMQDVRVTEGGVFETILDRGGVADRIEPRERSGGIGFRRVEMPFAYADGRIELGNSIATGPALAVRLDGSIDQRTGALDLDGVISPAYALSGFLDDIPVLGRILTGNRGEGVLAMTFSVDGTIENPDISVNPLSLLAPGILRSVFSGQARQPSEQFLEQLGRD